MRGWVSLGVIAAINACGGAEPAKPAAPITLDVPPMASASTALPPLPEAAQVVVADDPPIASAEPDTVPPATTVHRYRPAPSASTFAQPIPIFPPSQGGGAGPSFDKSAAAAALGSVDVKQCSLPGGLHGPGHVTVTFDLSGSVSASVVDQGPFPGTTVGACVARLYRNVSVPPFSGAPVRVGKSFIVP